MKRNFADPRGMDESTASVRYFGQVWWGEEHGFAAGRWFGRDLDCARWFDEMRAKHPDLAVAAFDKVVTQGGDTEVTNLLRAEQNHGAFQTALKATRAAIEASRTPSTPAKRSAPQEASEGLYDDEPF